MSSRLSHFIEPAKDGQWWTMGGWQVLAERTRLRQGKATSLCAAASRATSPPDAMIIKRIKMAAGMYSHLPRFRQIFFTFFKYGFGDVLKLVHLQKLLEIGRVHPPDEPEGMHLKPPAERFRMVLEELGPTFVKLGQILSTRRDLVNEAFYNELRKLQKHVPPFPGSEAARIVEEELGMPLKAIFRRFDETPVAAASIAQVHHAILKDGKAVAVKVQRPGISQTIEVDLGILADIARFLEQHVEEIAVLNPADVVREFSKTLRDELDFTNEAQNMERFAKQFRGNHHIRVPRVRRDLTSQRVLVMEYLAGRRVDHAEALRAHHIDTVKLSERMSKLIFQQMLQFGFFHGDPHPGNITILPGGVTVLYDYGMMGNLTVEFRESIATLIRGLVEKDTGMVMRSLLGLSEEGHVDNEPKLKSDVEAFVRHYLDRPLKDLRLGYVLNRLLDLLMEHKLRMKGEFYLGIKALSQVEAIGRDLNPDLNFARLGGPYATEVLEGKYSVGRALSGFFKACVESLHCIKDFPIDLRDAYTRIKAGRYLVPIELRINPEGFEPLRKTMNHIANRLVDAILIASVLICSALLILSGLPPIWHRMPLLGLLGLILGALMMLRLIASIWRHGGL